MLVRSDVTWLYFLCDVNLLTNMLPFINVYSTKGMSYFAYSHWGLDKYPVAIMQASKSTLLMYHGTKRKLFARR